MPEVETLGILEEIEALASDRLQVDAFMAHESFFSDQVSYKWLSRSFSVSSNMAKKLLQEFVEKHGHGLKVMYSVAGWLNKVPATYHIKLVPGPKLAEVKQEFDDNCSVQVYSVQVCIPKDPATIWNAEFMQAEELFKQPSAVDNCLRDNRFCGISNAFVKRNAEVAPLSSAAPPAKRAGLRGLDPGCANPPCSLQQPQEKKLQQSSPKGPLDSSNATAASTEAKWSCSRDSQNEAAEKSKTSVATTKKTGQSDKSSAVTEGSLSNFWGRASTKSKSSTCLLEQKNHVPKPDGFAEFLISLLLALFFDHHACTGASESADAQVYACEAAGFAGSDDDESDVNFKRGLNGDGGKKRRVVLDDSDDDFENDVNLGSPVPPMGKSSQYSKQKNQIMHIEKHNVKFDDWKECKTKVKEEKTADVEVKPTVKQDSSVSKSANVAKLVHENTSDGDSRNTRKAADDVPGSPKRRKVLKTRIDDRGREVTEVVWKGEETDAKDTNAGKNNADNGKSCNDHKVKLQDNAATHAVNRAATTRKSPAVGSTVPSHTAGKAGNKKGANAKDPKQGNILSFFKRV
ncbi:hypothetical protein Cgig2_033209 [Carnegiea gigantea]|uniref:DNA polymerase delta subunit 3 n=1 Tax=Carnegiea gigantea TaxID=171969 RepID=A0A9Q1K0X3_9CARY|nr:hypothetical protein Cgig2_033209 [Carnegiea gigantea]